MTLSRILLTLSAAVLFGNLCAQQPRNIVFVLSDDHRFDFMGFTGKVPWLETPHLDRLAREGIYAPNTYVTTALCSPSRASILTGLYSHQHTVVDNQAPEPEDLRYFPQILQQAGYQTGFFGKWHMGDEDDHPRKGFHHWESFRGQGVYFGPELNINGQRTRYDENTYTTDLLTDHALSWVRGLQGDQPFFLYLSHKAVHADFQPAARHLGKYQGKPLAYPPSFQTSAPQVTGKSRPDAKWPPASEADYYGPGRQPDWQKMQRESWHGADYLYHGQMDFETFYYRYCETLLAVDESVGRVLAWLDSAGLAQSTLVVYMGDNGFSFGEHGLIDKRHFYEESAKVPFLARCPELFDGGRQLPHLLQNIDLAPAFLDAAGLTPPEFWPGKSFLPLFQEKKVDWRDRVFYEYYWEYDFPHTPTLHGVRTDRYKLIRYHGVWDTNEFYDLKEDPHEMNNLIADPLHQDTIRSLTESIYDWLEATEGMQIPLKRTVKRRWGDHRNQSTY